MSVETHSSVDSGPSNVSISISVRQTTKRRLPDDRHAREQMNLDDVNRGKRLMGSLMGSLQGGRPRRTAGQSSVTDIEQRILGRQQQAKNEASTESEARKQAILHKRRQRQEFEMQKRHERMRRDSLFLKTTTQPSITFLPKVLTRHDTETIKEQSAEVEQLIEDEKKEFVKSGNDGLAWSTPRDIVPVFRG